MKGSAESNSDESILRLVEDLIEKELGLEPHNFDIEVEDGSLYLWGEVPSVQERERLEHLLFNSLDLVEIEFDVVVDEDLQSHESSLESFEADESSVTDLSQPNLDRKTQSPRRQF